MAQFTRLKSAILLEYRKHYPYFQGNWKEFSSQDIQNLIELVAENLRETVSEKWIYTHLKPEHNDKLPRKDMLDIFSRFAGYSGWDEFIFEEHPKQIKRPRKSKVYFWSIFGLAAAATLLFLALGQNRNTTQTIKVTDQFTKKPLQKEDVKVYKLEEHKTPVEIGNGRVEVPPGQKVKVVVKSPYYKPKVVEFTRSASDTTEISVVPDDRAMMLKAFLKSDIKDWRTRKVQLDKILSDDLEVIVMLKDNLGAEYFNKREFAGKLIIPTPSLKQMKIIEIKNGKDNKIQFIRMAQE